MPPIITLTTDFGEGSPYVAQMKASILGVNRGAIVVDITHAIRPQDVRHGQLVLDDVCHHFPADTIHVVVVDPGVGTERRLIYARLGSQQFLAPDNGLLTLVSQTAAATEMFALSNREFWLPNVSATFHGRDILAPVAAHLSLGVRPEQLGPRLDRLVELPVPVPKIEPERIVGEVLLIDRFGNLITNVKRSMLAASPCRRIRCGDGIVNGLSRTYGDQPPGSLVALIGSNERLELAVVGGSAAERLQVACGEPVEIELSPASSSGRNESLGS